MVKRAKLQLVLVRCIIPHNISFTIRACRWTKTSQTHCRLPTVSDLAYQSLIIASLNTKIYN